MKYKVKMEINYDGALGVERHDFPLSKSHKNALMREAVWLQVADAMAQYGFESTIKSVAVARAKESK